jgi:adenosylmethionine-8-amino-7-oxononanoate transaminase
VPDSIRPASKDNYSYQELLSLDRAYVWHPFTRMDTYFQDEPVIVERGEGVFIIDVNGKKYYDAVSSIWLNVHGHNHAILNQALMDQLNKIAHSTLLGSSNVPAILLAKELANIACGSLNKVFYSEDGAEAVEVAIKMAYQYWRNLGQHRPLFLTLDGGYHGDTLGAVSVGSIPTFHQVFKPLLFPTVSIPFPHFYRSGFSSPQECMEASLNQLDLILQKHRDEIGAFIFEPLIQGSSGMRTMPKGFLKAATDRVKEAGILLIADEVATGFGRTGTLFACEQEGVEPDLMALGKGLTGGYLPLAATLTTQEIFSAFLGEGNTFYHGHSYTGYQLGCALALANLELIKSNDLLNQVKDKARMVEEQLKGFADLKHVGDIRQAGLMVGIELVEEKNTMKNYPADELIGTQVAKRGRDLGILLRPIKDVIVFMPPLCSSFQEIKQMLTLLRQAICDVCEHGWRYPGVNR